MDGIGSSMVKSTNDAMGALLKNIQSEGIEDAKKFMKLAVKLNVESGKGGSVDFSA